MIKECRIFAVLTPINRMSTDSTVCALERTQKANRHIPTSKQLTFILDRLFRSPIVYHCANYLVFPFSLRALSFFFVCSLHRWRLRWFLSSNILVSGEVESGVVHPGSGSWSLSSFFLWWNFQLEHNVGGKFVLHVSKHGIWFDPHSSFVIDELDTFCDDFTLGNSASNPRHQPVILAPSRELIRRVPGSSSTCHHYRYHHITARDSRTSASTHFYLVGIVDGHPHCFFFFCGTGESPWVVATWDGENSMLICGTGESFFFRFSLFLL